MHTNLHEINSRELCAGECLGLCFLLVMSQTTTQDSTCDTTLSHTKANLTTSKRCAISTPSPIITHGAHLCALGNWKINTSTKKGNYNFWMWLFFNTAYKQEPISHPPSHHQHKRSARKEMSIHCNQAKDDHQQQSMKKKKPYTLSIPSLLWLFFLF